MGSEKGHKTTREKLLAIIERARRAEMTDLDLSEMGITELPVEIGQLVNLHRLHVNCNQLTALPESIGQLVNLHVLHLGENQLSELPESIGKLANLQQLWLGDCQLTALPESIGQLANLRDVRLYGNRLTALPESIGHLANLGELWLHDNQLTELPESIGQLARLWGLHLKGNPLNPALASAHKRGLVELRAYLGSLAKPAEREELYEAKLVLVGEGGVGKTTLLKSLTGRVPKVEEPTTHGVEIARESLMLPHPEKEGVEIKINAWDFGGQEVYRVTHQFFFSRRSVYLLVWEPRAGVQQCQVEDWLKLIRLRVGDDARVIIVSTHSKTGNRIARIDKTVLKRDYHPMIVDFREVDSLVDDRETGDKVGVAQLRRLIAQTAQDLPQMGMQFNRNWRQARDELLAVDEPRITYDRFGEVCHGHGLKPIAAKTLADLMHDLGYIVHYGDDPRLVGDVVLQPEWLTKAIGFVLEDLATQESGGILRDERLVEVWRDHPFEKEPRYGPQLYPFFLRLMQKYDVSYRLEDQAASLVAQDVPQERPELPWLPEDEPADGMRRIGMVCEMDESPPGLVPWMIVRTHEHTCERKNEDGTVQRLHWQRGMFLKHGEHGTAMLELRGREFHVYAEAVWPEFFMGKLRQTLDTMITDNWPGLADRYRFAVPCKQDRDGKRCDGRFDIGALRQFLEEGDEEIRCQVCRTKQPIVDLLFGFEEEDTRRQLARIESKLEGGFAQVLTELEGLESRIANYVMALMRAMANEAKSGPRLFTIEPVDGKWQWVNKNFRLHLWCEAEGCQHPVHEKGVGVYEYQATRDWVNRVAPYANLIAGLLRTVLPVAAPAVEVIFGAGTIDKVGIKAHLDLMKEATGKLLKGDLEIHARGPRGDGLLSEPERSGILALHSILREKDPNQERLGLIRVPTYTGDYLWLCPRHYEIFQPPIPDKIG